MVFSASVPVGDGDRPGPEEAGAGVAVGVEADECAARVDVDVLGRASEPPPEHAASNNAVSPATPTRHRSARPGRRALMRVPLSDVRRLPADAREHPTADR